MAKVQREIEFIVVSKVWQDGGSSRLGHHISMYTQEAERDREQEAWQDHKPSKPAPIFCNLPKQLHPLGT